MIDAHWVPPGIRQQPPHTGAINRLAPRKSSLLLPPGCSGAAGTNLPNGRALPEGLNAIYQSSRVSFHITGLVSLQLFPSASPTPTRLICFLTSDSFIPHITRDPNRRLFFTQADLKECIYFLFLMMSLLPHCSFDAHTPAWCFRMGWSQWVGGWVKGSAHRFHKLPTVVL